MVLNFESAHGRRGHSVTNTDKGREEGLKCKLSLQQGEVDNYLCCVFREEGIVFFKLLNFKKLERRKERRKYL